MIESQVWVNFPCLLVSDFSLTWSPTNSLLFLQGLGLKINRWKTIFSVTQFVTLIRAIVNWTAWPVSLLQGRFEELVCTAWSGLLQTSPFTSPWNCRVCAIVSLRNMQYLRLVPYSFSWQRFTFLSGVALSTEQTFFKRLLVFAVVICLRIYVKK